MIKTLTRAWFIGLLISTQTGLSELTPYKFKDGADLKAKVTVPASNAFKAKREDNSEINAYLSIPTAEGFPIAVVLGGSSQKDWIYSIIHIHRYFLAEFLEINMAVLTVEQRGATATAIDVEEFWAHYTRTERLKDHQKVIEQLAISPPRGWNGKFVFFGVSEGGPIALRLSEIYAKDTAVTLIWAGAGAWNWKHQLWEFIKYMRLKGPFTSAPSTREEYDLKMTEIIQNPVLDRTFLGMSYLYHADAMRFPSPDYAALRAPLMVVVGDEDPNIGSADIFARQAQEAGVAIRYLRIPGLDHYIRNSAEGVRASFEWLRQPL